ncbi:MAG: hypothetical protein Q9201_002759 [Fulgogasparrea decipioides]
MPAPSAANPSFVDEESPLLNNRSSSGSQNQHLHIAAKRASGSGKLSWAKILWIMSSIWVGNFVVGLDGTVMATLAAPIATSFTSLPLLAWLVTAFFIGQAAAQPLSGKLTDIFSRQWGMIFSNVVFAGGNIICGFAKEKWIMILGRLVAGIGGGCVNSVSTILVSDLVPLRQRGIWQGIGNVFWGLGNGLGGVFGGYIIDTWDWRIAFVAQVPFTLVSLLIVCVLFDAIRSRGPPKPADSQSSISRVDFLGSFLLVSTLVLFLTGLTTGGNIVPWSHPLASATLPSAAVLFCGFIYVEEKVAREPILPLHFLRNRTILCACLTNCFSLMTMHTFVFYFPIYYRIRGISNTQTGAALIPFSIGLPFESLVGGAIATRTGRYRSLLWAVLILMLAAAISSCAITLTTPLWLPKVYLGSVGAAAGGMLVVTLVALLSSIAPSEQAVVTSLSYIFRSTGSVVGLCVASAVYQQVLDNDLWARFGGLKNAVEVIHGIRDGLDYVDTLPHQMQSVVRGSYLTALRATFSTTVAFAVGALVCGVLVKELNPRSAMTQGEADNES